MTFSSLKKIGVSLIIFLPIFSISYADTIIHRLTSEVTTVRPDTSNVTPTPAEDGIITNSIQSHIKKSATLSKLNVNVQTHQGVVTLSGNVDSDSQASTLIELAQSIVGVKDVDASNLAVKNSQQPLADTLITAKIRGLLIREDIFGTKDIASVNLGVETKDGVVYLTGPVENQDQLKNAIKLIEGVKGVVKVEYNVKKVTPITRHTNY